jgi:hypothetical protein
VSFELRLRTKISAAKKTRIKPDNGSQILALSTVITLECAIQFLLPDRTRTTTCSYYILEMDQSSSAFYVGAQARPDGKAYGGEWKMPHAVVGWGSSDLPKAQLEL